MKQKFDRRPGTPKKPSLTNKAGEILARAAAKLFEKKQSKATISDERRSIAMGESHEVRQTGKKLDELHGSKHPPRITGKHR